ncbi:hypothetical protein Tco_1188683 [Tanacetum coccineum]
MHIFSESLQGLKNFKELYARIVVKRSKVFNVEFGVEMLFKRAIKEFETIRDLVSFLTLLVVASEFSLVELSCILHQVNPYVRRHCRSLVVLPTNLDGQLWQAMSLMVSYKA